MIINTYVDALVETLNKDRPDTLIELQDMLHPFKRMGCKYYIESVIDSDDNMKLLSIKLTGPSIQGDCILVRSKFPNKFPFPDIENPVWYWTSL